MRDELLLVLIVKGTSHLYTAFEVVKQRYPYDDLMRMFGHGLLRY